MVTEFELIDAAGKVLARGEIDDGIYRLFSKKNPSEYQEFETLEEMFATCGRCCDPQPWLFEGHPHARDNSA